MRPKASRKAAALGLLAAALVLTAGCTGKSAPSVFSSPSTAGAQAHTVAPAVIPAAGPVLPLTGLPAKASELTVPVVAVALGSGDGAASGSAAAETVFVEYSDSVRLLALFQSVAAARLGPIGPTRPLDGSVLAITGAIFANSGGPAGFVSILDASAVTDASSTRDPGAYQSAPGGLFTSTDALRRTEPAAKASPPLFTFAAPGAAASVTTLAGGAKAAHQLTVTVAGHGPTTWTYDAKAKAWNTPDPAFAGGQPRSLIVQQVSYKSVQLHHPGGAYVPSAKVFGHGLATVVSGPSAVSGQWSKPGPEQLTVYGDANGVPVHLTPGITWVLLVPTGTPVNVS